MWLCALRYPFIPTNPLLAAVWFISFFLLFLFFSSYFLYALFLLNHKTWKFNFCVKLLSCKRNFFSRIVLGQLHREPPQNRASKNLFFERLKLKCYFFAISRYLTEKYFDIVWGCHLPGDPQKQFFERLNLECQCFMIAGDI